MSLMGRELAVSRPPHCVKINVSYRETLASVVDLIKSFRPVLGHNI